jgi:hypothetical protein
MEDVELVLRFFAYRQISSFKAGLNKISEFLDRFLVAANKFSEELLAVYKQMFESTVDFLWDALGTDAFCMIGLGQRPTKIIYDPIMFAANSDAVMEAKQQLIDRKDVLHEELRTMYVAHQALFSGRRTNFVDTQQRNAQVREAFAAAIAKTKP